MLLLLFFKANLRTKMYFQERVQVQAVDFNLKKNNKTLTQTTRLRGASRSHHPSSAVQVLRHCHVCEIVEVEGPSSRGWGRCRRAEGEAGVCQTVSPPVRVLTLGEEGRLAGSLSPSTWPRDVLAARFLVS